jgi:8-oxo-dGTP diphosphatase
VPARRLGTTRSLRRRLPRAGLSTKIAYRYGKPVNAASVALLRDGKVLLIQRAFEPLAGLWTLPGGRSEPGEQPEVTAIREIREELGLQISGLWPVTEMVVGGSWRLAVFATRTFRGVLRTSDEVADWRWVTADAVARLDTTPGLAQVLALASGNS